MDALHVRLEGTLDRRPQPGREGRPPALPEPGPQPTIASNTGGPPPGSGPKPAPNPTPGRSTATSKLDPQFDTCGQATDAGYGPYHQGQDPEYDWYKDGDGDGVNCES